MSNNSAIAENLRLDLDGVEDTSHHGRINNPPTADGTFEDGTVRDHGSFRLVNGWRFPNSLAIDHLPTEGAHTDMVSTMTLDVYPPHLDAGMNGFGGGFDSFGAHHEDAFDMGHLRGPNPLDTFSLSQPLPSSSAETTSSMSSALSSVHEQVPGPKSPTTPASQFEPYTLPSAGVPLHLLTPAAPVADHFRDDWQSAPNQFPFFDQPATFGVAQQLPPDYAMEAPGVSMSSDMALGQLQLPDAFQMDVPTVNQGIPDTSAPPINPRVPPADGPKTVKNRATPIHVAMRSLEQVASLAATHLPPVPKAWGWRIRNRQAEVGTNSSQATKRQGRSKRGAAATKATPQPEKRQAGKDGAKRTGKTKSSLSRASRTLNQTKPTNRTYVKPCSPKSQHQCRFNGCTTRCYDRRTLQRHERTHYRADADMSFCPGMYISRECEDHDANAVTVEIGCTCPPWGYSREDALLRHLRYVLGKEWEGYDDPCVQAAMIIGWDPVIRSSFQRLRPYKPQPPVD